MKLKKVFLFLLILVSGFILVGCQGEPGIKGEPGDRGDQGLQGETGEKGEQGKPGKDGQTGEQGPQGIQGETGEKGDKGEDGKEIEFRVSPDGILQQRYVGEDDNAWKDVFDVSIIAKWRSKYTVELDVNGGTYADDKQQTKFEQQAYLANIELPTPTMEGFVFLGWSDGKQTVNGKYVVTESVTLVAKWADESILQGLVVGTGEGQYATIKEALDAVKPGEKIILTPGTYTEQLDIKVADITIMGPNAGINGNDAERKEEAVITNKWTVHPSACNFTIDGLTFKGGAQILNGESAEYFGFNFINNKVLKTNTKPKQWVIDRYQMNAFLEFKLPGGGASNDFNIQNNHFENISMVNVMVNRANNLSVDNNVFLDFGVDALRCEGGYNKGVLSFTNNHFEQTERNNGYNAMFLYALSGGAGSYTHVIIDHNVFKNIGTNKDETNFNGTIAARVYQENKTDIDVKNNVFDHCVDGMHLRNNGANTSNWSCTVENNQFLGLPEHYYYASYYGGDSESTNPHLAKFTKNYYEDNDGKVISDLAPHAALFKHMASYGEALAEKPATEPATPLEFYTITYDLDGGTVKLDLPRTYSSVNDKDIELPKAMKENFNFKGWLLNGNVVNKIPADTRGNLKLKAVFQAEEGELHNVTYKFEGGYSEALLVKNHGDAPTFAINNYNYNNGSFWGGAYASDIFIGTSDYDPTATFSDRVYIGKNVETGLYEIKGLIVGGQTAEWASGAEYVITISSSYSNFYPNHTTFQDLKVGDMVAFDTPIDMIDGKNPGNVYFFTEAPAADEMTIQQRLTDSLVVPSRLGFEFLGWYDDADKKVNDLSGLNADMTLTAKWKQKNPVKSFKVDKICSELTKGDVFDIVASVVPADAYFKTVYYESDNTDVLTVDANGHVVAINAGVATITLHDYLNEVTQTYEVTVYAPKTIDVDFAEGFNGVLKPTETMQLVAKALGKGTKDAVINYQSLNNSIATVNETGLVTAVANGKAEIQVSIQGTDVKLVVNFLVGDFAQGTDVEKIIALIVAENYGEIDAGNISLYNDGKNRVYVPTYGSVNSFLFDKFEVDTKYYAATEANPNNHKDRIPTDQIEFVTVHDTATLTGTVDNIGGAMSSGETSVHYSVGNDKIIGIVPEKYIAYHAGDGTGIPFEWTKTDAKATENVAPVMDVVADGGKYYISVNGVKSAVEVPTVGGQAPTKENFTHLGPVWKVENGYYYVGGPLWESYGGIGSRGGNNNSIGIEMCSNETGDIYDTFQRTAMLVSDILIRNNLDTTRVKQHNTWSKKNCPQTVIAGNLWDEFMRMVELQYTIRKDYKDAEISIKSNNPEIIDNTGRVINAPEFTTMVSYDLTVKLGTESKTVTLYNLVPGTATWEQWDGIYSASKIWNEGNFNIK